MSDPPSMLTSTWGGSTSVEDPHVEESHIEGRAYSVEN